MVSFREILYPAINVAKFRALLTLTPKRVCFGSTHQTALKRSTKTGSAVGFLNLPFSETIDVVLPWQMFPNKSGFGGIYRAIMTEEEYGEIENWLQQRQSVVFIRSLMDSAISCCEHYQSSDHRSDIGELEYRAKFQGDGMARKALIDIMSQTYKANISDVKINTVVAVPSTKAGADSLPAYLARNLSEPLGLQNLSGSLRWTGEKGNVKELGVEEKWAELERVGLLAGDEFSGRNVLIIDDMYQSGATAHFVAAELRKVGADAIHLLSVSKGRRDTDNR